MGTPPSLRQFLIRRRDALVERFIGELRRREPPAEQLPRSALLNHLPQFFDEVIFELDRTRGSLPDHVLPSACEHGVQRWHAGFDLRTVIREYGLLRHVILRDLEAEHISPPLSEVEALLNCLNAGVAEAVSAFVEESEGLRVTLTETRGRLDAHELRLRLVTENIPQIVWTADRAGKTEWFNRQWYEYTGTEEAQASAWQLVEVVHPEDRERAVQLWNEAVQTEQRYEVEYRLRRRDGLYRWFLGRATPVLEDAAVTRWFGTCTDIDDQKQTEARLRAATQESERLNRLKDEFLATVSHELRTPLQSMLGWARLLRAGHLNPEREQKALYTIERNAKAQSQLIEDILDVSRIITGKARIHAELVDVATVLSAAIDTTQPIARAKGVHLIADLPAGLGTLTGDADRLQQVVWNLLSNGIKFTPPGGHVRLRAERSASTFTLLVEDDGQGIPEPFLPYVFDRFRQADAGPARAHGGLGIGLSIVRHIVELHGGVVSVFSSGVDQGATFRVDLPSQGLVSTPPVERAPPGHRSDPAFPAVGTLVGVAVLVVDDQPDARELVATILQQYGADVREASSAQEALDLLLQLPFHVLVSDLGLPHEDGYSLIERVRRTVERPDLKSLPALALTAYASDEDRQRALSAGYHQHLKKPIEPAHLLAAVSQLARHTQ